MDPEISNKQLRSALLVLVPLFWVAGCATPVTETAENSMEPPQSTACLLPDEVADNKSGDQARQAATASTETPHSSLIGPPSSDHKDIWSRLRSGYGLPKLDSKLVTLHEQWFANNPEYMSRMMERARLYLHYIVEEVEKRGMPTEIALLPAIESAYQPYAYSRARAAGLWQFIAPTGRLYGLKMNWWYDGRRDVMASTQAALDYLEKLYNEFDGDWHLALAAYNAGEGKINRMQGYNRARGKPTDFQSLKLKRETVNYVPKLVAMANIVADPEKYGVQLADIPNHPYFARVETNAQIDLGVVAKLVDLPIADLQVINPGYTRWATDPDGPHHLLVPADKKEALEQGLSSLAKEDRIQYRHHAVARGDTLSAVANRYGVTPEAIRTANGMHGNLLRAGQDLLIPVSSRTLNPVVASAAKPVTVAAHPKPNGELVIHHVRAGDTLWSIARRYNVLVDHIRKWNLLEAGDVLRLGQRLRIWPSGRPSAALSGASPNS
jgi:membrane-bound lytic murein transglycosylase D